MKDDARFINLIKYVAEMKAKMDVLVESIADLRKTPKSDDPRIHGCCRDMEDAYNRGIICFKTTNGEFPFLYVKTSPDNLKAICFCPFCGAEIDFGEWFYMGEE